MTMTEREQEFYNNLVILNEDKLNATKALRSKGVEKHIMIKEKLLAWSESECVEYSKIASTYRYDKRIRNTLFKYISYLEEYYRSIILDNYRMDPNQPFWNGHLLKQLNKYGNDLNDALEHTEFSYLLNQCKRLSDFVKAKCSFPDNGHINKNIKALIELRNAVMHNKFLLLYRGFEVCYVSGVDCNKSATLKANILNLIQFLPKEVGSQCKKDINSCKENRNQEHETAWDLPPQIVISLRCGDSNNK